MGSSVPGSKGARLRPVWRKGMTMTIGPVRTIILVVCKKLTPLVSSQGWGEPIARRRVAGRRQMNGGRVRDAHRPEPKCLSSTGELIDIERVTISSEGDHWKSTRWGNSLVVYPTSRPVLRRGAGSNPGSLAGGFVAA